MYRKIDKSKAYEKYSEKYEIGDEEWKRHYTAFRKLDVPNKAKDLQYKILQNYVATNKLLYKMNIKPNPRCNFCNLYTQDTAHLFFECIDIKDFWLQLNNKLEMSGQMGVNLHIKNILFGEETSSKLQDKKIILAKWYTYQCKYADRMPCCDLFIEWMNRYSDISVI